MKVLMLGRIGLMEVGGGDKVQIENTASELRKLGVEVDISTDLDVDVTPYDIVHVFQLDWTAETYFYIKKAKAARKFVVLSPIHHSLEEVKKFDDDYVFDYRRIQKYLFKHQFDRDTFKNVYRVLFDLRKLKPTLLSIFMGLEKMHRESLKNSDVVLVQTVKEAEDLEKTFKIKLNWKKVVNGVSESFLNPDNFENRLNFTDYIVCVGRIEPRKNQLNVIKAIKELRKEEKQNLKLVLVGRLNFLNHVEYTLRFLNELKKNDWITHLKYVPYDQMPSIYHFAKVGVSASWFETTGLTSIESLFCGANAVAAGERAKEYLGDRVTYCKPDDLNSIKEAIKKEYYAARPVVDDLMRKEYTWKKAAEQTLKVYESFHL